MFYFIYYMFIIYAACQQYAGQSNSEEYDIKYNVDIERDIYQLTSYDKILYCDDKNIVFTSSAKNLINQIVTSEDCQTITIINSGNITSEPDVYIYHGGVADMTKIIKSGTIQISKRDLNRKINVPFCIGFNTDGSCMRPSSSISLFHTDLIDVLCDNCFIGFSGNAFIDLEFSNFHLNKVAIGFDNMKLLGGLGVNVYAEKDMSYVYNKIYTVLNKFKLVSFNIGLLHFEVNIDLPIDIYFSANMNAVANLDVGSNLNVDIGALYIEYTGGKFQVVKPKPVIKHEQYLDAVAGVTGNVYFRIIPSISVYSNSIFKFNVVFEPYSSLKMVSSTATREVCVNGDYEISGYIDGTVLTETIPRTSIYDSGIKQFVNKCYKF